MAGVWRVFEPGGRQVQFIIGSGDVNRDVEMTQCLHYYGSSQEEYSLEELSNLSRFGRVPAVCGEASVLVQSVLERLGHEARIVTALRLGNFNHYDNGHTVLEVRGVSGDWMVFDPGYGGWLTEGGQHVNLLTLQDSLKNLKSLAFEELRFRHYGHFFSSRLADLTFELENKWTSPNQLLNWYRETFEIVGIEMKGRPGHYEFLAPSYVEKRIVKRYSTNYYATTRDSFVAKYYSGSVTP